MSKKTYTSIRVRLSKYGDKKIRKGYKIIVGYDWSDDDVIFYKGIDAMQVIIRHDVVARNGQIRVNIGDKIMTYVIPIVNRAEEPYLNYERLKPEKSNPVSLTNIQIEKKRRGEIKYYE